MLFRSQGSHDARHSAHSGSASRPPSAQGSSNHDPTPRSSRHGSQHDQTPRSSHHASSRPLRGKSLCETHQDGLPETHGADMPVRLEVSRLWYLLSETHRSRASLVFVHTRDAPCLVRLAYANKDACESYQGASRLLPMGKKKKDSMCMCITTCTSSSSNNE